MIRAYFDGCCEPVNPGGTAAYGAVIFVDGERIWQKSEIFFPQPGREKETSNNVAEYSGFRAILIELIERKLNYLPIEIYGDSNLVIQQMFGTWRIKQGFYVPLAHECRQLLEHFPKTVGEWIPRERNTFADELSKKKLKDSGVKFRIQPE